MVEIEKEDEMSLYNTSLHTTSTIPSIYYSRMHPMALTLQGYRREI